jgi:hypothetical protein
MNQTDYPSLAATDTVAGFVYREQEVSVPANIDRKTLESSCVDLICKLENQLSKAKDMQRVDYIDESATIGRSMLELLLRFTDEFLTGKAAEQAQEEIARASTFSHTYDEVLKSRSLKESILRTFWKADDSQDVRNAHKQLGEALIRACAATFYHAVMLVGIETEQGKQIDQSTVVFVHELQESWN